MGSRYKIVKLLATLIFNWKIDFSALHLANKLAPKEIPYISKEYAQQLEFTGNILVSHFKICRKMFLTLLYIISSLILLILGDNSKSLSDEISAKRNYSQLLMHTYLGFLSGDRKDRKCLYLEQFEFIFIIHICIP